MEKQIRFMVIGAHPDDAEQETAALALKLMSEGHAVKFLSVSNGSRGHHVMSGGQLAQRRAAEAANSGKLGGFEYEVLDIDDCEVVATLENRKLLCSKIREFRPNVIVTHRPNDYHPDHRNTSMLVQDCAYLLAVPMFCPLSPVLKEMPVILYMADSFRKPYPFQADLILDSGKFVEKKAEMKACHYSQYFEWLPWIGEYEDKVPADEEGKKAWMLERTRNADRRVANRFRKELIEAYGEKGNDIEYAEAYELSEYGSEPSKEELYAMFGLK